MQLISEHVTYAEATVTSTGMKNDPGPDELYAMHRIALEVFEPLRLWVGGPIKINSFYRSPEVNRKVGGSKTSQHVKGEAMDLDMDLVKGAKKTNAEVFKYIWSSLPFDQLIYEFGDAKNPAWVHVSLSAKGKQRRQVLKAVRTSQGTKYVPM
jgi:zinc D-Ala-D-Ala carboxypeptidase